ncbi:unnamed protein product, partial [Polarella glacialis]
TLEPIPPKWKVMQVDVGTWTDPRDNKKWKFVLFTDEGCRLKVGKLVFQHSTRQVTWDDLKTTFEELWVPHFGKPEVIRMDPDGAWRNRDADAYFAERGVLLEPIPAEAHWQIGIIERAIQATKKFMNDLANEFADITPREIFSQTLCAINSREMIKGYSSIQHAVGRVPDEFGRMFDSGFVGAPPILPGLIEHEFGNSIKVMATAEKSFLDWQANERLKRADHAGSRPLRNFCPGDLVYYWRKLVSKRDGSHGFNTGRFIGPARILAVETRVDEATGELRPGSCVWLYRCTRLIKAAPEQLRAASEREEAYEELRGNVDTPWTVNAIMADSRNATFDDISDEIPEAQQWTEAQEPQAPLRRIAGKRWPEASDSLRTKVKRTAGPGEEEEEMADVAQQLQGHWTESCHFGSSNEASCYWADELSAVSISIDCPTSQRGKESFHRDPVAYVANHLKRQAVEVCERKLEPAEAKLFQEAKGIEIKNFIASQCFEALPEHLKPSQAVAMKMRWILTWKSLDKGGKKAKARAVILGYQDLEYEFRPTASPAMSRTTRQLFLQLSAWKRMKVEKGDVTGAFLQGREFQRKAYCIPTVEIYEAMGLPPESITRLRRAAYGLGCPEWEMLKGKIKDRFKWQDWEPKSFIQCGVRIKQRPDFGFELDQEDYLGDVHEIEISKERRRQVDADLSAREQSQMRAALGAIGWHAQQLGMLSCAGVSLLLSQIPTGAARNLLEANKLIYQPKCLKLQKISSTPLSPVFLSLCSDGATPPHKTDRMEKV